ncbi:zinc finger CCCH domain-containing protein 3 [Musca autumnalis]|uniref:zinc finger CCCH domain-containing protein 3 n=1 Tax=Musca autumnalis TaxID=221902 RepID=UPI003CF3DB1C
MLPQNNNNPRTIYINPNFKGKQQQPTQFSAHPPTIISSSSSNTRPSHIPASAHINPLFLERTRPTIHMNPRFLLTLQDPHAKNANAPVPSTIVPANPVPCTTISNSTTTKTGTTEINNKSADLPAADVRKIICKSKNRLIREPLLSPQKRQLQIKPVPAVAAKQPIVHVTKRKLIRKPAMQEAKTTSQATKIDAVRVGSTIKTKYKLDNRIARKKPISTVPSIFKIKRKSFVGRFALRRTSTSLPQSSNSWKKFGPSSNSSSPSSMNKKLQVLNINGLLYKSTRNSLKLKDLTKNSSNLENKCKKPTISSDVKSSSQGLTILTIFVRGTKYIMDAQKHKLTRVTGSGGGGNDDNVANQKNSTHCRRIDIGGFTYISTPSTKNILIRTRNHLARAYVNNAKQKSLQILSRHLVKSNVPCPIYQRVGKCAAFERGKCLKVHNKQQVAICSKFLRGECINPKCLLSHEVSLSKMPVCKFYMQGVCVRNDCPYLHKKLSDNAEVCIDFLRGYCQLADKCNKRHEFVCPELERNGVCNNKNCVYCKSKQKRENYLKKQSELHALKQSNKMPRKSNELPVEVSTEPQEKTPASGVRYFIGTADEMTSNESKESVQNSSEVSSTVDDSATVSEDVIRKRPKLGELPAFIPL